MSALDRSFRDDLPVQKGRSHFTGIVVAALAVLMVGVGVSDALLVSGTVRDQDGRPIQGALVAFVNEADETQSVSEVTGNDGSYQIDLSRIIPTTSVSESNASKMPTGFGLLQNYPNPFNPETIVRYQTPEASDVSIIVYNSLGQRIRTLVDEYQAPGFHRVQWDARDDKGQGVAAGVYLYQMRAGGFIRTRKMLLLDGSRSAVAPFIAAFSPSGGSRKPAVLAPFFAISVTGEGFFDYWRSGVAIVSDTIIDVTVNSALDKGMLRLSLTDAPVDLADAVNVTISSVQIRRKKNDPWETFGDDPKGGWIRDSATNVVGTTVDLLGLTGGVTALLGEAALDPGAFTGVRLMVDSAEIVIEGEAYDLFIPSGAETGLKLQGQFEFVEGEILDLTLDFDVRRSVVRRGQVMDFLLKPVIRLVSTSDAGSISGCVVVEEGVVVEEIKAVIIAVQNGEEISSAKVDPEDGTYRISYLPAGSYDLKVEKKGGLTIVPERIEGVVVVAGEETADMNFTLIAAGGEAEEEEVE